MRVVRVEHRPFIKSVLSLKKVLLRLILVCHFFLLWNLSLLLFWHLFGDEGVNRYAKLAKGGLHIQEPPGVLFFHLNEVTLLHESWVNSVKPRPIGIYRLLFLFLKLVANGVKFSPHFIKFLLLRDLALNDAALHRVQGSVLDARGVADMTFEVFPSLFYRAFAYKLEFVSGNSSVQGGTWPIEVLCWLIRIREQTLPNVKQFVPLLIFFLADFVVGVVWSVDGSEGFLTFLPTLRVTNPAAPIEVKVVGVLVWLVHFADTFMFLLHLHYFLCILLQVQVGGWLN